MANTTDNPLNTGMFPFQGINNFQPQLLGAPQAVSDPMPAGKGQGPDLSGFSIGALNTQLGDADLGGKGGGNLGGKPGGGNLGGKGNFRQDLLASLPQGGAVLPQRPNRQQRRRRRRRRRQEQRGQALQDLFSGRTQTMGQRATRGDLSGSFGGHIF